MALLAFAGNSVLCRLALQTHSIDGTSFTLLRLFSGAIALLLIVMLRNRKWQRPVANWGSSFALFLYAWMFSLAYLRLDTATGALILFGCVQITMIGLTLLRGGRLSILEWLGSIIAVAGFVWLMLPSAQTPDPLGAGLMAIAGIAWGIYTLKGAGSKSPLADTTSNFVYSNIWILFCVGMSLIAAYSGLFEFTQIQINYHLSTQGIVFALASGVITSGVGYAIWYAVLSQLSASVAATSQLSVPILAALGGVLLVNETLSMRLVISAFVILTGIALVIYARTMLKKV